MERHLVEAYQGLQLSSSSYDAEFKGEAIRIAQTIRVLVHDTKDSKSLFTHMGLKDRLAFFGTPFQHDPRNLLASNHLVMAALSADCNYDIYEPFLDRILPIPGGWKRLGFDQWWGENVSYMPDHSKSTAATLIPDTDILSRRALILALANKEGGAHVDDKLDKTYARLSRLEKGGVMVSLRGGAARMPMYGPELATVRQIGHEILKTLEDAFPYLAGHKPNYPLKTE